VTRPVRLASELLLLYRVSSYGGNMLKNRIRLGAWTTAIPLICISAGGLHAQTPASSPGSQLWTLILAPFLSGAVGIIAAFVTIRFDVRKTVNQELIRKRISIYDAIAPKLNDLLCFFLLRGNWRSLTPPVMIQNKRELDKTMYVYGPLFTQTVFDQYNIFIQVCFKTFMGVGRDACLRANHGRLQSAWGAHWKPEWDICFVPLDNASKNQEIMGEYDKLPTLLASEIGAHPRPVHTKAKRRRWWNRLLQNS
jgi:hypothetical protein